MIRAILATFVIGHVVADAPVVEAPPPFVACPAGNALHVVYVCDASESMRGRFDALKRQLLKSIDALKPVQEFTVIFLADGQSVTMSDGTVPALVENKRRAAQFVNGFRPSGGADPVAGFRAAFATRPHFVYWVTSGDIGSGERVVDELHTLNRDMRVKVNTVALQAPGGAARGLLGRIAEENGGRFRTIGPEDRQR
jgi:hypothetical protein